MLRRTEAEAESDYAKDVYNNTLMSVQLTSTVTAQMTYCRRATIVSLARLADGLGTAMRTVPDWEVGILSKMARLADPGPG